MPIIFITGHGDIPMTVQAMKAGAVEFLTKPFSDEVLLSAIRQALERSRLALGREAEIRALRDCYASLTPRERQVMALVVSGLLNKQVGGELGISEITVKAHRGQVMRKMKADSLADLVTMAARLRLARVPGPNPPRPPIMRLLGTSGISDSTQGTLISLRPKIVLGALRAVPHRRQFFTLRAHPTPQTATPIPLDRVLFRCESTTWSEPVPTRIASATIHSRGRDSCSGLVFACSTVFGPRFSLVSMVSINLGIRFYGVETGDAGETIEPEESH